jgi:hypothetical protein
MSHLRGTINDMDVTAALVAKIPTENLRVRRADFAEVWTRAETLASRSGPDADYFVGVVFTCRWLAAQPVWSPIVHLMEMPRTPIGWSHVTAMPETIEDEYLNAVRASVRSVTAARARGVVATLDWAWHGNGRPPIAMAAAAG